MANVLVTSGEERSALAAARSLGRAGHRVVVCSESGRSLAGASCWARDDRTLPSPVANPEAFAVEVAHLAAEFEADVVLPVTDPAVLAVLRQRDDLPADVRVPFPSLQTYRRLSDKARVTRAAESLGISVPEQQIVPSSEALGELRAGGFRFPVVVKPTRSVVPGRHGGLQKTKVSIVATAGELRRRLRSTPDEHFPVLLQEHVPGSGAGVFLLRWDGRTYARFAHRRLREKPPSGGVSVYRESVEPPSGLFEASERLLEHFGWKGVAMVEYRVESGSGTPYLMEVNGRLWGSLQLAVDAGVDFPRLLVALCLGQDVEPVTNYRKGVRCRWEWGEVDHLIQRVKGWVRTRGGAPVADGGAGLASLLLPWRPGDRYEVFRLRDPAPFARETGQWFRRLVAESGAG